MEEIAELQVLEASGCLTLRVSGLEYLLALGPFDWTTKRV